jgi:hypothetical protein
MSTKTEGRHTGEFLVSEAAGTRARAAVIVTVPASTVRPPGLVLGRITATGKYVAYNDAAVDGSQTAVAVLYDEARNDTGAPIDVDVAAIVRDAEVRTADLDWNAQAAPAITAGLADLATVGIIAR